MGFGVNLSSQGQGIHVEMRGELDEVATLPTFAETPRELTLDLGGVRLINSVGVKRWMSWIEDIGGAAESIRLERCSYAVVQQLNIVDGFLPARARVTSLFVPYECPRCGHGARVLHQCDQGFRADAVPEHLTCAACGGEMILEVVRPSYFRFLSLRSA